MKRYHEVDFIKGLAVISMVIFHYFYLGTRMNKISSNYREGIIHFLARFAHITFIIMVGINLVITRLNNKDKTDEEYRNGQYKRVLYIAFIALLVSVSTYIALPDMWIRCGILHFIAMGILICLPLVTKPNLSLMVSVGIYTLYLLNNAGYFIEYYQYFNEVVGYVLGLFPVYNALDNFTFLPFLSLIPLGIFIGHNIYKYNDRKIKVLNNLDNVITKDNIIVNIGKNSLNIYMVHFVILYLYFRNLDDITFSTSLGSS